MCQSVSACRNSLCKYADDTYVIIPANNEASRLTELDNVQTCTGDGRRAEQNNLKLNCSKSTEIIFRDNRRRHTTAEPAPLSGIARCSCMKMPGVTVGNDFSVSQHVHVADLTCRLCFDFEAQQCPCLSKSSYTSLSNTGTV